VIQADSEGPVTIDIRGNVVLDNARRDTSDTHGIKVGDLARGDSVVRVAENQVSGTPSSQNGFEHNGIQIYESKGVDVSENEVSYVDIGVKLQSNATAWLTANHIELTRETSILVDDTSAVLP
jgi:nitrous oxidase accessory protein NosD